MESSSLIPGFRFHPTDHELVMYYLKRKLLGKKIIINAVAEVNIYDFCPWDLPDKSAIKNGDLEWFFFCPKSKKYTSGSRSNRATKEGFWKATGKDRKVEYNGRTVATIKTLVFHIGHASDGKRTNWVMHEYNMKDQKLADAGVIQDLYVICKVFEKEGAGPKNGAQYGAPFNEQEWDDDDVAGCAVVGPHGPTSMSITEPGTSTVTIDTPGNDDVMLFEDLMSVYELSTDNLSGNNKNKGVEFEVGKSVGPNEEDGIYDDLVNLINLDEFMRSESNKFENDGSEYTLDMIMSTDDLDADLGRFMVD